MALNGRLGHKFSHAPQPIQRSSSITGIFKEYGIGDGSYHKNYEDIYNMVNIYDGVNTAIRNAKRRMSEFDEKKNKPSQFDPGTTVYKLVEKLKSYLEE